MKRIALLLLVSLGVISGMAQHFVSLPKEKLDELRITAHNNASSPSSYTEKAVMVYVAGAALPMVIIQITTYTTSLTANNSCAGISKGVRRMLS